jgi:ubiquinone/menaquinone biosynthesis C-methylase UbiE
MSNEELQKDAERKPLDIIAEAFSRTAEKYDSFAQDHPHLSRIRQKVYAHIERFVPLGDRILELNAGTGADAAELARRGYFVHATDISPGMLARVHDKVIQPELANRISVQKCSYTRLDEIHGGPYDVVFSNLGGLNCIPDLTPVIQQIPRILKPNGLVIWVLMPPVCLWELAEIFRGHFRLAFRRLGANGVKSHLEGMYFTVHYFTPRRVVDQFGDAFEHLALEGLSVFTPTAESKNFAKRFPRLYKSLAWLDDWLAARSPWNGWGDFFILTLRFRP